MNEEGLTNIHIDGEKLLVLDDILGREKAREAAEAHKVKAFGVLAGLLSRPKPEDIEIVYEEKRFDAFWHVLGSSRFEYRRRKTYRIPVDNTVQDVEILGTTFAAAAKPTSFEIDGMERCIEEYSDEALVNAQNGEAGDYAKYLKLTKRQITSTEELSQDGTPIVALEAKPAFLVRKALTALIKPIKADEVLEERIGIDELALYFIPIYTFEFLWKTKDKRVTISFDGTNGELMPKANKIAEKMKNSFTGEELFEFGKEVANFVPGGGLAMMVGKKAVQLAKK